MLLGTCLRVPQNMFFECFLTFLGQEKAKNHSKNTFWGTPSQAPKTTQKRSVDCFVGIYVAEHADEQIHQRDPVVPFQGYLFV